MSVTDELDDLDPERVRQAVAEARSTGDLRALEALSKGLDAALAWRPQEYQQPPPGKWWSWVFSGGAGSGKTDTGAWHTDEHMMGPPCDKRVPGGHKALLAGPTFTDAVTTCWAEPAGISAHNPKAERIGHRVVWPNGAEALIAGMHTEHDAELFRARAANVCYWWVDEGALARHLKTAVDILALRARLGAHPHGMFTSTPKPVPGWKHLLRQPDVITTYGSSYDNAFLPEVVARRIRMFEGTAWGQQEIHGQLVEYFEGALWNREGIEADAIPRRSLPDLNWIALGVDPSTWEPDFGDDPGTIGEGLETGIVAAGVDRQARGSQHAFVLGDWSGRYGTARAARVIVDAYHALEAIAPVQVVLERNNDGGILAAVNMIDSSLKFFRDPSNPKRVGVHAAEGKRARAEPVSAGYDQHRVHHLRPLAAEELWTPEDGPDFTPLDLLVGQMVLWDPRENWSPDRLDALVWAVTALDIWAEPASVGSATTEMGRIPRP